MVVCVAFALQWIDSMYHESIRIVLNDQFQFVVLKNMARHFCKYEDTLKLSLDV